MIKSLQRATLILALAGGTLTALTGCFPLVAGGMVTGALVASDRRTTGTVAEDQGIEVKAANRIQDSLGDRALASSYVKYQIQGATGYRTDLNGGTPSAVSSFNWGSVTRTVAEETQNFANWFSYYRSRAHAAKAAFGFDAAYSIEQLDKKLPELLVDRDTLWHAIGHDAAWDARIAKALNAVRAQTRPSSEPGCEGPQRFPPGRGRSVAAPPAIDLAGCAERLNLRWQYPRRLAVPRAP